MGQSQRYLSGFCHCQVYYVNKHQTQTVASALTVTGSVFMRTVDSNSEANLEHKHVSLYQLNTEYFIIE